ncbi:hypothetical protein ACOL3G_04725 [Aliarcobacter butzleri]|uniref:hypothetical protein n=1 Tax=Aliarcobacter butzleri TaxID=28197 RepID=UPI0012611870|nr:hypothetical protein [Aliarcobacter butzleri]
MEIGFKKIVCNLMGITVRSYSNWANKGRPIISFLEKGYLNKNELQEFLDTGKIKKLDLIKKYSFEELEEALHEKLDNKQNIVAYMEKILSSLKEENQKILLKIDELKNLNKTKKAIS